MRNCYLKNLFIAIVLLCSVATNATIYTGTCGVNLTWSLDTATSILKITGIGELTTINGLNPWDEYSSDIKTIIIGNGVKAIDEYTFDEYYGITNIKVESGNTVYDSRDDCNAVIETATNTLVLGCAKTTIPYGITSIGNGAFNYCQKLTDIVIPNSVTSIGEEAFYGCGLTSINIPNSVTSIGDYAFNRCRSLTSINIPNSVTSIGEKAFYDCSGLEHLEFNCNTIGSWFSSNSSIKEVVVGNSVTSIGENAFKKCYGLTNIIIPASVKTIGKGAFNMCRNLTSVVIPSSVTSIGEEAFSACYSLINVEIPNGVASIGNRAFNVCSSLTSVTIPSSVTSIGNAVFSNCSSLTSIKVEKGNTVYDSRDDCNAIIETATGTLLRGCSNTIIPNSVTSLASGSFSGCLDLESVAIGDNVTEIGQNAFGDCKNLASVTIPSSVKSIGIQAFVNCHSLNAVCISDLSSWCNIDFADFSSNPLLKANSLYLNGNEITHLVIPSDVTRIKKYAFYGCNVTKLTIPNNVTNIENFVFNSCVSLKELCIEDGNNTLNLGCSVFAPYGNGFGLFNSCPLETLYIGRNLLYGADTNCGYSPFCGITTLGSVTMGKNVTSIGGYAFCGCEGLTSVIIPNGIESIGAYAFSGCSALESVTIPSSVTNVGAYAFNGCLGLTGVYISDLSAWCKIDFDKYGYNIFETGVTNPLYYANNLYINGELVTNLVIPNDITEINPLAFDGCINLVSITIPAGVTSIGSFAFRGCTRLVKLYSKTIVPAIVASDSFYDVPTLTTLYVPIGAKDAYQTAEYWKNSANIVEIEFTGIEDVIVDDVLRDTLDIYFDLNGRMVDNPTGGIYIKKGKKVVL
ncbi:MAG: leucine-rich repeat domain-containing protein [Bacteroidaceae bacterium]|nr:leucine-rich repeat domain-containing protein [Bacteroidaceae bacterium]